MKKKVMAVAVAGMMVLSTTVLAASSSKQITVTPNQIKVVVNGKNVTADNFVYNGTTYLPLRAVSEAMGSTVNYDDSSKTASITSQSSSSSTNSNAEFTMDATTADVYYELLNSSQAVYDSLENFSYVMNSDKSQSDKKDYLDRWASNVAEIKTNVSQQQDRINKYEAKNDFYKTSFTATADIISNLNKEIDLFDSLKTKGEAYLQSNSEDNSKAVGDVFSQIGDINDKSVYSQCQDQHDKYMTRITD